MNVTPNIYLFYIITKMQPHGLQEELLHAAEVGDLPSVQKLLHENPDLDVNCRDLMGRTPLRLASGNEHLEVDLLKCQTAW